MRAVVDNPTLTSLSGARPFRIRAAAWSIGSGFAALSGILLAPTLGLDPNLLTLLVVQAFGACAIGLFTSLPMTYAGGLLVGVVASVATKYLTTPPFSGIPPTVPYLFLIVILLVVPASRLPQRRASIRSLIPEVPPMRKARAWTLGGASAVILLFIPVLVGPRLPVWTSGLTYSVILGSLALLVWVSGQISLCHMAFAAVGATTMAHLDHHLPWGLALLLAGVVAAPVGVLVAIPSARMSGIYLALLTLGFGILMQNVIFPTFLMFGTTLQVKATRPRFWFIDGSDRWFYYVTLLVAALTYWVLAALYRGQLGRLLRAMSETPTMLTTHGLSVSTTRLLVFSISAFLAGIGGALLVTQSGVVAGEAFGPIQSLILLAVLAICGTRLLRSPILAAILLAVAPAYVTRFGVDQQTFGFGLFAVVAALVIAKRSQVQEWLAMAATSSASRQGRGPVINNVRARPSVPPTGANPAVSQ
jgi:ABC-type branched-subunit amino acid transport system permease subunit